jgi:hypothetical protein
MYICNVWLGRRHCAGRNSAAFSPLFLARADVGAPDTPPQDYIFGFGKQETAGHKVAKAAAAKSIESLHPRHAGRLSSYNARFGRDASNFQLDFCNSDHTR